MTSRGLPADRLAIALVGLAFVALLVGLLVRPGTGSSPIEASGASPGASGGSLGLGSSASGSSPLGSIGPEASPAVIPAFAHVFVLVMENKAFDQVIGSPAAPYLNGLASRYALATGYTAVTHPSQPNYLALWSGSTQGVLSDATHDLTGRTLADEIEASGRTWRVAAQNVPLDCYKGSTASGGEDGPGTYARKHEPAISFTSISGNPSRCASITDLSHFDPNAGNFWLIVPNLCNDTHDCSVATGDAFLRGFLPMILDSPAFSDSVVFVTWDEGVGGAGGGGRVPLLAISPRSLGVGTSSVAHDHYSLLRTIEDAWGLPCLANACRANDLRELFR